MKATARLYLTACTTALVAAGDPRAATLYASPGDDIPDSAAEKFGLVDGDIADGTLTDAILRVATVDGAPPITVDGIDFTADWRAFAKGEIHIGHLLDILKEPSLKVEALQFVGDEAHQWAPLPGLAFFLPVLERQVAAAQALGLPLPRIGEEVPDEIATLASAPIARDEPGLPAQPEPPIDDVPPPPPPVTSETSPQQEPPVKEADAPAQDKEAAPAANKEARRADNKGAGKPAQGTKG